MADLFPIPVIEAKGLCDIEIDIEGTSISTKLSKEKALKLDYEKLGELPGVVRFEVYGVEDYLQDYYVSGEEDSDYGEASKKMAESAEAEFFFSFYFEENIGCEVVSKVVGELKDMGAYY